MNKVPMWRRYIRFLRSDVRADVDDEIQSHLEMRTQELIEVGMPPATARAEALAHFGDLDEVERELVTIGKQRELKATWVSRLTSSWLDFRLGARMLSKHPGLTVVAVVSMALAIGASAGIFGVTSNFLGPSIPLPQSDRIVSIQHWNVARGSGSVPYLVDLEAWRESVESMEDLSGYRIYQQNLTTENGSSRPVHGSAISASAFRVTRVPPLLGRYLVDADEEPGAPDVVVIGYDLWLSRFDGDPQVVGRTLRIGLVPHTIVGVMPEGFRFPFNDNFWTPLADTEIGWALGFLDGGRGYAAGVFGRLRDGVTIREAQAELALIGQRRAIAEPERYESLRPRVLRFGDTWADDRMLFHAVQLISVLLMVVVCANIGALIFVRNAAREAEMTVRSALGASRRRIVLQLFIEGLVLASIGALGGLVLADQVIGVVSSQIEAAFASSPYLGGLPFWWQHGLPPSTLLYVGALTLLGATVSGLLPAISLTRIHLRSGLQRLASAGSSPEISRGAKISVVTQIALSVTLLTLAVEAWPTSVWMRPEPAVAAEEYLTGHLTLNEFEGLLSRGALDARAQQFRHARETLLRRLQEQPGVLGVTMTASLPGLASRGGVAEIDGAKVDSVGWTPVSEVDTEFFRAMNLPMIEGRGFEARDVAPDGTPRPVAVVSRSFAERKLGNRSAIGLRVRTPVPGEEWFETPVPGSESVRFGYRFTLQPGPWLEVIGVVNDLGLDPPSPSGSEGIFVLMPPAARSAMVTVRLGMDPGAFIGRLWSIGATADPNLRLSEIRPLDVAISSATATSRLTSLAILIATVATVALTLCGVYSMMSYFLSRRTREIGIRIALGARPLRVVTDIFSRAFFQLGMGLVLAAGVVATPIIMDGGSLTLPIRVSLLMMSAGILACAAPTWRALKVQPTEVLRTDS